MKDKKDEGECEYCRQNPDVLNTEKGYAVLWPEVKKEIEFLESKGMTKDLAVTTAMNHWIVWVTGSSICKIKSRQMIIRKFWEIYNAQPKDMDIRSAIEKTTKDLCVYFKKKFPEAWKCFCGEEYKRKVSGGHHD